MAIDISNTILATGALGTAAFGIVEGLKWTSLGEAGFGAIMKLLGPLAQALQVAYGSSYEELLRGEYRGDTKELLRVLRQGVRVGLTQTNVDAITKLLGSLDPVVLASAIKANEEGRELTPEQRNAIGRFELAADARIDAAVTVALGRYAGATRIAAAVIALILAAVAASVLTDVSMAVAILVGIAAVPLAPIAKDVASGIQAATNALRAKT